MQRTALRAAADAEREPDHTLIPMRVALSAWLALALIPGDRTGPEPARVLDCRADFKATMAVEDLKARFGSSAVKTGRVYLGEGEYAEGTLVFPDSEAQLEVLWKNNDVQRSPLFIRVRGERSAWATQDGISLGTELRVLERLNGGPFRLLGFAWDYEGTVMSWSAGHLRRGDTANCRLRLRLRPPSKRSHDLGFRQVLGDREYSSGHPAMQGLNPIVYEMWLDFGSAGSTG